MSVTIEDIVNGCMALEINSMNSQIISLRKGTYDKKNRWLVELWFKSSNPHKEYMKGMTKAFDMNTHTEKDVRQYMQSKFGRNKLPESMQYRI